MDSSASNTSQRVAEFPHGESEKKVRWFGCLLLAAVTVALYSPITRAPFLNFDDASHVVDNQHVRAGLTWPTVVWAFTTSETSDWHPMTWLSHALDCQLFGVDPEGHHTTSLLLHAANAVLLFLLLANATGMAWRSLAVAALFALHPINVESVAWIAERKNVLSMFFFLLALGAYGWYARRPGVGRYLLVTFVYGLGLMSKAQVVTFPCALLLLDYWPLERLQDAGAEKDPNALPLWRLALEKLPWLALSAASAVITMRVETPATQANLPFWIHLENAVIAYVRYLGKAFWPKNLALVYPHPELSVSPRAAALSALLLVILSLLAVIFRRRRALFVGWFWFLGTLVPMLGLVQIGVHAMADRYAYIPFLGLFVIVCWSFAALVQRWHVPKAVALTGITAVFLALGLALHRQVLFWENNIILWNHTLQITEGNYTAEDNLATALIAEGKVEEAVPHLQRARSLRPDDAMATLNLATYEQMQGHYQAALDGYAQVPRFTGERLLVVTAQVNSGYAHYSLKQYGSAKQDFEAALKRQPDNSSAYRGLGLVAQKAGDLVQAARYYQRSVELQPSSVGYLLLAQALELQGQMAAGRAAEAQASRLTQDPAGDLAAARQFLIQ
jgi:Tfp pilus assembly protein PilF